MTPMISAIASVVLRYEEGYRSSPYLDSKGYLTVGYGRRISDAGDLVTTKHREMTYLLSRIQSLHAELLQHAWYCMEVPERQAILISMSYQMGTDGLLKFRRMLAALSVTDYATAADEMLDSAWHKSDAPQRAERHAKVILKPSDIYEVYKI